MSWEKLLVRVKVRTEEDNDDHSVSLSMGVFQDVMLMVDGQGGS